MIAGTAILNDASTSGSTSSRRSLQKRYLPWNEVLDCVVICLPAIHQQFKTFPFFHHFITAADVAETFGDLLTSGFFEWDTHEMRAIGRSSSSHWASSTVPHTSEVAAIKSDAEDVAEDPTSYDTTSKEVAVRNLDPQSYTQ